MFQEDIPNLKYTFTYRVSIYCIPLVAICCSPQEIGLGCDAEMIPPAAVIAHELFDSIVREIVEEVGIARDNMSLPVFTGLVSNLTTSGRCSMAFYGKSTPRVFKVCYLPAVFQVIDTAVSVRSVLTAHEIRECYKTAQDVYESTGIVLAHVDEVLLGSPLLDDTTGRAIRLAPAGQGTYAMFYQGAF
jgi:hypothetical protein